MWRSWIIGGPHRRRKTAWYRLLAHAQLFLLYFRKIVMITLLSTCNNIWTRYSKVVYVCTKLKKQCTLTPLNLANVSDPNGDANKIAAWLPRPVPNSQPRESIFPFLYMAIIIKLKVIQLANGCIFRWYGNISDIYVLISLAISKCKWIPRFFREWSRMCKQVIFLLPRNLNTRLRAGIQVVCP